MPSLCPTSSTLLNDIVQLYHTKLAGEDDNIKVLFLVGISKFLPPRKRNHVIVLGPSSGGKSYLVHHVFEPFKQMTDEERMETILNIKRSIEELRLELRHERDREKKKEIQAMIIERLKELMKISDPWGDDVIEATRITPAGIDRAGINVDGKIFIYEQIAQYENGEAGVVNLRAMLSEGKLALIASQRNPETGDFQSVIIPTIGMPVFVTTSTKFTVDPEFLNRVIEISIDESEEQTVRIMQKIADEFKTPEFVLKKKSGMYEIREFIMNIKKWLENGKMALELGVRDLNELLSPDKWYSDVIIPYADKLLEKFPKEITARRDFRKALALTYAYTFLHQKQRPLAVFKKGNIILGVAVVSIPTDFIEVCKFAAKTLIETFMKTTKAEVELLEGIKKAFQDVSFTVSDVMQMRIKKWSRTRTYNALKHLVDLGYLDEDKSTKPYRYKILSAPELPDFSNLIAELSDSPITPIEEGVEVVILSNSENVENSENRSKTGEIQPETPLSFSLQQNENVLSSSGPEKTENERIEENVTFSLYRKIEAYCDHCDRMFINFSDKNCPSCGQPLVLTLDDFLSRRE